VVIVVQLRQRPVHSELFPGAIRIRPIDEAALRRIEDTGLNQRAFIPIQLLPLEDAFPNCTLQLDFTGLLIDFDEVAGGVGEELGEAFALLAELFLQFPEKLQVLILDVQILRWHMHVIMRRLRMNTSRSPGRRVLE